MDKPIIEIKNISKMYRISHKEKYNTIRDSIANVFQKKPEKEEFWALRDISLDLYEGDVLGIIGKNGAGKTTLLKILSRITSPTKGEIKLRGRLASLLEVGTGFHPELTGRENIYLNGAILGLRKNEISRKFDDIVDFSGVELFLDTPVKRYSSGMYVRLAFSVAAHLEPEILVIDEVLAVGDVNFQKKCLGKMKEVSEGGRTVLFVSHNMAAIRQLCVKGILLDEGRIVEEGDASEVIDKYLSEYQSRNASVDLTDFRPRKGNGYFRFTSATLLNDRGQVSQSFSIGDDVNISFKVRSNKNVKIAGFSIQINAADGTPICRMVESDSNFNFENPKELENLSVIMKDIRLYPGDYFITLWIGDTGGRECYDRVENCLMLNILDGGELTTRPLPRSSGFIFFTPEWTRN